MEVATETLRTRLEQAWEDVAGRQQRLEHLFQESLQRLATVLDASAVALDRLHQRQADEIVPRLRRQEGILGQMRRLSLATAGLLLIGLVALGGLLVIFSRF